MDQPLPARLAAEALGTFLFFFMGFSGIAVVVETGAGAIGPLGVAAGFGFGLVLAITAFGHDLADALGTAPGAGIDDWGALILEAVVTALLVMVILTVTAGEGAPWRGMMAPLLIGLVIFTGATAVGPESGGSFNPARSFVPIVYNGDWGELWIYLVGPFAGGVIGAVVWTYVCTRPDIWTRTDQTRKA